MVDLLHIARQNARLFDRRRDVTSRRRETRGVVGREEVVVDRLRNAETAEIVTLFAAVFFDAADGVHRVVAAREEVITNIVLFQLFENAREVGFLNLVTAASEGAPRGRFETFDDGGVDRREVDQLVLHKAFDAVLHPVNFVDFRIGALLTEFEATLNDAAKARVDDAGGAAALTDDRVPLKHNSLS